MEWLAEEKSSLEETRLRNCEAKVVKDLSTLILKSLIIIRGIIESVMHTVNEWTELCMNEWMNEWMNIHMYVCIKGLSSNTMFLQFSLSWCIE